GHKARRTVPHGTRALPHRLAAEPGGHHKPLTSGFRSGGASNGKRTPPSERGRARRYHRHRGRLSHSRRSERARGEDRRSALRRASLVSVLFSPGIRTSPCALPGQRTHRVGGWRRTTVEDAIEAANDPDNAAPGFVAVRCRLLKANQLSLGTAEPGQSIPVRERHGEQRLAGPGER